MSYSIDQSIGNNSGKIGIFTETNFVTLSISSDGSSKVYFFKSVEEIEAFGRSLIAGKQWMLDQQEIARQERLKEVINRGKAGGE